jgi:hypothetical protein
MRFFCKTKINNNNNNNKNLSFIRFIFIKYTKSADLCFKNKSFVFLYVFLIEFGYVSIKHYVNGSYKDNIYFSM